MNTSSQICHFIHAETILELPAVLEMVAKRCLNARAKEQVLSIRPSADQGWIENSLGEIGEMRTYLMQEGEFPLAEASCRISLEEAAKLNTVIAGSELVSIAFLEETVRVIAKKLKKLGTVFPMLEQAAGSLTEHQQLCMEIASALDEEGNVVDEASDLLASLRKKIASTRESLRREAERLAAGYGDNAYSTVLEGRFKLLVPRYRYKKGEGIVHSKSHSGGSLYFEPLRLVEKNNALETLVHDEKTEEARILRALSARASEVSDELLQNMDTIEMFDALRAKALFAMHFNCITPAFSAKTGFRLVKARHPLLETAFREKKEAEKIVPLDLEITDEERVLVITGPNAGGKTVALKTVGLVVLMCQCGLQVPCQEGTVLTIFENVLADIGDEQSIASSLSTFTSHLRHLDTMCRLASKETLCLIDEIGDGTDPDEGSALANAALERLLARGSVVVATTHYGKVKTHALVTDGLSNASMLFDDATQQPLYMLLQGVAGRSRGIETARRCGFDEDVLRHAESILGEKAFRLESILSELEASHKALETERSELEKQSEELKDVMRIYVEREKKLRELEATQSERARREAEELLSSARREIERIVKEIRESGARKGEIKRGRERLKALAERVREKGKPLDMLSRICAGELSVGDKISLNESGSPSGIIIGMQNDMATVEITGKRIKINIRSLFKLSSESEKEPESVTYGVDFEPLGSTTIDVRGMEREEALEAVDRFIDRAILNGIHEVKVIHGVGAGILLDAIRDQLQGDPRVKSSRLGRAGEGGAGVSFAELV